MIAATRRVARGLVAGAVDVGEDVGKVAVAAIDGAVKAAGNVGADTTKATQAAVVGVIRAADRAGSEAGSSVRKALLSTASLPRDVIEKAVKGSGEKPIV